METVAAVLEDANSKIAKSFDALKAQFAGLRTGKASPAMVDQIKVDYYGAPTPIKNRVRSKSLRSIPPFSMR